MSMDSPTAAEAFDFDGVVAAAITASPAGDGPGIPQKAGGGRRRERARLGSFVRAPMYLKGFCKPASFLRHPSCETRREGRGDGEFGRTNDSRATTRRGALGRN